jgi:hypothetical protein
MATTPLTDNRPPLVVTIAIPWYDNGSYVIPDLHLVVLVPPHQTAEQTRRATSQRDWNPTGISVARSASYDRINGRRVPFLSLEQEPNLPALIAQVAANLDDPNTEGLYTAVKRAFSRLYPLNEYVTWDALRTAVAEWRHPSPECYPVPTAVPA